MSRIIYQLDKEKDARVKPIDLRKAVRLLENPGWWAQGMTESMLLDGETLWTPFSYFSKNKEKLQQLQADTKGGYRGYVRKTTAVT